MALDALVKPFLRLSLFQGLSPLQLTEIVRRADRVIFKAGQTIIEEDQPGDCAIVIVSGDAVRLAHGRHGDIAEPVAEGSILSELSMLVETTHSATIVARTTVKALRLRRSEMHDAMIDDPTLAEHMSAKITARLQKMADDIRSIDRKLSELSTVDLVPSFTGTDAPRQSLPLH